MTCTMSHKQNMSSHASAPRANAAFSCANIAICLDAILLASILIICALISLAAVGVLCVSLVLLAVLLEAEKVNIPGAQRFT